MGICKTTEEIAELMLSAEFTILPVADKKKLPGIISVKNIINALVEEGFWSAHAFRARNLADIHGRNTLQAGGGAHGLYAGRL